MSVMPCDRVVGPEDDPIRRAVMSGDTYAEAASDADTYPNCGCQPDDCPDREGVEAATPDADNRASNGHGRNAN